jgi:hypothetical protein
VKDSRCGYIVGMWDVAFNYDVGCGFAVIYFG